MPFESNNQRKAMYAAASGNSTIGIPQGVAQKFVSDAGGAPAAPKPANYGARIARSVKRKALAGTKPKVPLPTY